MWAKGFSVAFLTLLMASRTAGAGEPVLRLVRSAPAGTTLLLNADFEQATGAKFEGWGNTPNGYKVAEGQGRNGSRALLCENSSEKQYSGANQTIVLNRTTVAPLVLSGWSKAEQVSGGRDNDYSLYVDILYMDGTPLWGQTAQFSTGTHDWQRREVVILPAKPIKSFTLHCLLRNHSGRAWFDEVSLREVAPGGGTVLFQGAPMLVAGAPTPHSRKRTTLATRDGLKLSLNDSQISSLVVNGKDLRSRTPSGFLVRDVAANSDVYAFQGGECPELGLKLQTKWKAEKNYLVAEGRLSDLSGKDRAVTLLFALPVEATGWQWGDDIRRSRRIEGATDYVNQVTVGCGATGTMSLYPLAPVFSEKAGVALGLDMAQAAQCRLGYHAGLKQLYLAYDFGLAPETSNFPRSADFRFVLFRFDPQWGFRSAFQKFTEIFPEHFRVRSHDQGIWMPFTDVSTVQGWQDFGFKYHEGNNNVPWDDAHGILSFRYTEPMTWWMRMEKGTPRTPAEASRIRDGLTESKDQHQRQMALVTKLAAMWDESGQPNLSFHDTPWCDGAVWSLNPNPQLPAADGARNAATVYWSSEIKQKLYGPGAKGQLDGEYLDSLEGYVTADLNYRREHFRYASVPLTFDLENRQVALYKGLAVYEFTKWLSTDVHSMGKLMFANGVPYRFGFLCPWLDVLGTETDWLWQGQYRPAPDTQMCCWRTLSGQKPYLLLMNTDYDRFTPELVERYFQRSLFYGMFPSMFSHNAADHPYWGNPKWYNRDRALFKQYQPLIKQIAEAGWQPVTLAHCDNARIWVERFGPDARGNMYFTLLNDSDQLQRGWLEPEYKMLRVKPATPATELISGQALGSSEAGWQLELRPQEAKVLKLEPAKH